MRDPRPVLLLALTLAVAGCGGSSSPAGTASSRADVPQSSRPAAGDGKLSVGASGSGIGDAAVGTSSGVAILPSEPVPGAPNTETGVGAGADCPDSDIMPSRSNLDTVRAAALCLLNGERSDAGLRALRENSKLARAATRHSEDMVEDQFFDHEAPNGSDPVSRIRAAGYIPSVGAWTVGENLAWGSGSLATPRAIVGAWMKSSGHRENILRAQFKEIGLGIVSGNPRSRSGSGATFTTTFGGITGAKKRTLRKARSARSSRKRR